MAAVPEMRASLPATAIGKDFPYDGRWIGWTPSGTGIRINLGGYLGLTLAWVEGLELNLLGGVAGSTCAGRGSSCRRSAVSGSDPGPMGTGKPIRRIGALSGSGAPYPTLRWIGGRRPIVISNHDGAK